MLQNVQVILRIYKSKKTWSIWRVLSLFILNYKTNTF